MRVDLVEMCLLILRLFAHCIPLMYFDTPLAPSSYPYIIKDQKPTRVQERANHSRYISIKNIDTNSNKTSNKDIVKQR